MTSTPVIASQRVLLIEDDGTLRSALRYLLTDAGYAVTEAAYGELAVDAVRQNPCSAFDCIVVDYSLGYGVMTGGEVVNAVRAKCPDIPVLFLSGHDLPEDLLRGEAFLPKPADGDRVLAEVARLIRSKCSTLPPGP